MRGLVVTSHNINWLAGGGRPMPCFLHPHNHSRRAGSQNISGSSCRHRRHLNNHKLLLRSFASSSDDISSSSSSCFVSPRALDAVQLLPLYLADARSVTRYNSDTSPHGALQLGVAESLILEDWLVPALNIDLHLNADSIYYQTTHGRLDVRLAMSGYMERLLGLDVGRIDPEGLVLGAGCNAVLENLCFCLAQPGDSVLVPTPYYAAFEFDLAARVGLVVQPVTTQSFHSSSTKETTCPPTTIDPTVYYPNTQALDAAYERSLRAGHTPRILLMSHPQNPLGICYPPFVIEECIEWCRNRKIHYVSDEIYAGSVYRNAPGFVSALKLGDSPSSLSDGGGGLGPFVHWIYALSKDFCLSGLRVGAAYSENEQIRFPMQKLNDLCQISSSTQQWTALTLTKQYQPHHHEPTSTDNNGNDDDLLWWQAFQRENHKRLLNRCNAITSCLKECGIPYLEPTAGLFVWVDLSKYLPPLDELNLSPGEQERALYLELIDKYGLLLTPGWSMRNERPGFFRCVFTAATDEEFALSLERFRRFAASK